MVKLLSKKIDGFALGHVLATALIASTTLMGAFTLLSSAIKGTRQVQQSIDTSSLLSEMSGLLRDGKTCTPNFNGRTFTPTNPSTFPSIELWSTASSSTGAAHTIVNENGTWFTGTSNGTTLNTTIPGGTLSATLSSDGKTLNWANNTYWTRLTDSIATQPGSSLAFVGGWMYSGDPTKPAYITGGITVRRFWEGQVINGLKISRLRMVSQGTVTPVLSGVSDLDLSIEVLIERPVTPYVSLPTRRTFSVPVRVATTAAGISTILGCQETVRDTSALPSPLPGCDPTCNPSTGQFCDCDLGEYVTVSQDLKRQDPLESGIRRSQPSNIYNYCIGGSPGADRLYPGTSYRVPQGLHWIPGAALLCPPGYIAINGGANCQVAPHGGYTLTTAPIFDPVSKKPVGWSVDCCVLDGYETVAGGPPAGTVSPITNYAYVFCRRE